MPGRTGAGYLPLSGQDILVPPEHSIRAVARPAGAAITESGARNRGRPKGAKTKKPATKEFLAAVEGLVTQEDFDYLEGTLSKGETPELKRDLEIFLSLQLKAVLPALASEVESKQLSRETTQRSSVVKELLALRFQMEKQSEDGKTGNQYTFIQNIFDRRGIDPERVAVLAGLQPRLLPRTAHDDQGSADEVGAVPNQLPERHVEVQGGGEVEADWVQLDNRSGGAASHSGDAGQEGELHLGEPEGSVGQD